MSFLSVCVVYTELHCKLARLQVQVKELQEEQQVWLQYKNEGSIKDQQKIQKLEKDIALTQRTYQEISGVFPLFYFVQNTNIHYVENKILHSCGLKFTVILQNAKNNVKMLFY